MTVHIEICNPPELGRPLAQYSQLARVQASELLFVAGMVASDAQGVVVGESDFDAQAMQTFRNVELALRSAGASLRNVVQFTTYLVRPELIAQLTAFRAREFPRLFPDGRYPPSTLLVVDRLIRPEFMIEIQTIAAL